MNPPLSTPTDLCEALGIPFSDEQLQAITQPLGPSVVIAGAGTGKTTVMAARVVWLVGTHQVQPHEVLGLTFTRKAAAELASRVRVGLEAAGVVTVDEDQGLEQVMTYDSFAARLVSEFGLLLGIDHDPVLVTGASRFRLAARAVRAAPGPFTSISRLRHHNIPQRVLDLDSQLQAHLVTTQQAADASRRAAQVLSEAPLNRQHRPYKDVVEAIAAQQERLELLDLVDDYQEVKRKLGAVEYADQLWRAVRLAEEVPTVAAALRQRHRVVLLDEYQDTSSAQARLLTALFGGEGFPVTAVGDPRQAIYGWRGAAADNIAAFARHFPQASLLPAPTFPLSVNRRSGQRILDVGNVLAADLPHASSQTPLQAPDDTPPGHLEVHTFDTLDEELDWLADDIERRHREGTAWPDIAVLVRRNATLARVFEVLRDRGVPAEMVGLGGLLHLPEVVPVVSTLRALDDVASNPEVAALLTSPRWQVGLSDLEALGRRARALRPDSPPASANLADELGRVVTGTDPGETISLLDAIAHLDDPTQPTEADQQISGEGAARMKAFAAELAGLRQHIQEPVADLVRRVVTRLGIEEELRASPGREPSQLVRFTDLVTEYVDVDGDGSLRGLLAWLDAEAEHGVALEQAVPTDANSVKLLTVHRAKGLEWHTVYLPALVDKTFPAEPRVSSWTRQAATLPAHLRGDASGIPQVSEYTKQGLEAYLEALRQEHRHSEDRLAYVAVTRAKQVLIGSRHVWSPGRRTPDAASPYFVALAEAAGGVHEIQASQDNPRLLAGQVAPWPQPLADDVLAGRRQAADWVAEASRLLEQEASSDQLEEWVWQSGTTGLDELAQLAQWDEDADALMARHTRRGPQRVELPEGVSATTLMAVRQSPGRYAQDLVRPMPRQPSAGASLGSRFHDWLQQRFSVPQTFEELDDTSGDDAELQRLIKAFSAGQFADRQPLAVEAPFVFGWGAHVVRGRIDAVYAWDGQPFEHLVVDWKTSTRSADPLQLAVYRHAWAQSQGMDPERVGAAFFHITADRLTLVDAPTALIADAFGQLG